MFDEIRINSGRTLARMGVALSIFILAASRMAVANDLAKIAADWGVRRTQIKSIRCVFEGTSTVMKGAHNGDPFLPPDAPPDVPPADYQCKTSFSWAYDFVDFRVRKESVYDAFYSNQARFVPNCMIETYDGVFTGLLKPRLRNSNATFTPDPASPELSVNCRSRIFNTNDLPLLFACGYIVPIDLQGDGYNYNTSVPDEQLSLTAASDLGQEDLFIVRTAAVGESANTYDEFWVDGAAASTIVRWKRWDHGTIMEDAEIQYAAAHGFLLPSMIRVSRYYHPDGGLSNVFELNATMMEVNSPIPDREFILAPEPGMVVYDCRAQTIVSPPQPTGYRVYLFLASMAFCAVLSVLLVVWRRYRGRPKEA